MVTVAASTPNTGTVTYAHSTNYNIVELVTLDADSGLFVGITQDVDENNPTGFVVAGRVNQQTHEVGTLSVSEEYGDKYSVSPVITRLSDSTFAIGYYSGNPSQISTRYGKWCI